MCLVDEARDFVGFVRDDGVIEEVLKR